MTPSQSDPVSKPIHPTFGAKVRWWRRERGLTLEELAARARISREIITAYETGRSNPSYDFTCRLAIELEVPTEYLWDHMPAPGREAPARRRRNQPSTERIEA